MIIIHCQLKLLSYNLNMASVHHVRDIVASNIKRLRKERGITQAQLAEMTDLSNTYIANIECGKTWISDKTLEKLTDALEVEFQVLFLEETESLSDTNKKLPENLKNYLLQLQDNNTKLLSALEKMFLSMGLYSEQVAQVTNLPLDVVKGLIQGQ